MDWKDKLSALAAANPDLQLTKEEKNEPEKKGVRCQNLRIELDKKGRNGKQATLIFGFEGTEGELKDFARQLKTTCGTGGSVRDGEILIQGDWREKLCKFLTGEGHKVKRGN
jgi:translation initiation factor 1